MRWAARTAWTTWSFAVLPTICWRPSRTLAEATWTASAASRRRASLRGNDLTSRAVQPALILQRSQRSGAGLSPRRRPNPRAGPERATGAEPPTSRATPALAREPATSRSPAALARETVTSRPPAAPAREAVTSRPPAAPTRHHVSAAIRREVWARDAGRCAYTDHPGRRCPETAWSCITAKRLRWAARTPWTTWSFGVLPNLLDASGSPLWQPDRCSGNRIGALATGSVLWQPDRCSGNRIGALDRSSSWGPTTSVPPPLVRSSCDRSPIRTLRTTLARWCAKHFH